MTTGQVEQVDTCRTRATCAATPRGQRREQTPPRPAPPANSDSTARARRAPGQISYLPIMRRVSACALARQIQRAQRPRVAVRPSARLAAPRNIATGRRRVILACVSTSSPPRPPRLLPLFIFFSSFPRTGPTRTPRHGRKRSRGATRGDAAKMLLGAARGCAPGSRQTRGTRPGTARSHAGGNEIRARARQAVASFCFYGSRLLAPPSGVTRDGVVPRGARIFGEGGSAC